MGHDIFNIILMYEFSSEALLHNCLLGNYEGVKRILENCDSSTNKMKHSKQNRAINTMVPKSSYHSYSAGEIIRFKINLEITDKVRRRGIRSKAFFFSLILYQLSCAEELKLAIPVL